MAAKGMGVRAEAPDMEVMDVEHAGKLLQAGRDALEIQAFGEPFEQDVERIANDAPGGPDDQQGYHRGENRVDAEPACGADDERSNNDADGAHKVAKHMDEGSADIEVVFAAAMEGKHNSAVEKHTGNRYPEHDVLGDRRGVQEAGPAFVENPDRQSAQGQRIDEAGENAGTLIAVGSGLIGGAALDEN